MHFHTAVVRDRLSFEIPTDRSPEVVLSDRTKDFGRAARSFLRLSVRGMIVAVLVMGIGLGWLARRIRSAGIQRDAVVAIRLEWGLGSAVFAIGRCASPT